LPQIAPAIADALSSAKLVTISGGGEGGAPQAATANIASVIQTVLAAQLVTRGGILDGDAGTVTSVPAPAPAIVSSVPPVVAPARPPVSPKEPVRR
jgi:flotillin